jgi:hypothetical protein
MGRAEGQIIAEKRFLQHYRLGFSRFSLNPLVRRLSRILSLCLERTMFGCTVSLNPKLISLIATFLTTGLWREALERGDAF